jgi:hypothetical protein
MLLAECNREGHEKEVGYVEIYFCIACFSYAHAYTCREGSGNVISENRED